MTAVPDIPRLYTALAECLATLLYARQLAPRYSARHSIVNSLIWMAGLAVFMQLTGSVPLVLWLPCMVAAIGSMYLFLWRTCETTPLEAGYYCARAFILAELAASVEWQLHCGPSAPGATRWPCCCLCWCTVCCLPPCTGWKSVAAPSPPSCTLRRWAC